MHHDKAAFNICADESYVNIWCDFVAQRRKQMVSPGSERFSVVSCQVKRRDVEILLFFLISTNVIKGFLLVLLRPPTHWAPREETEAAELVLQNLLCSYQGGVFFPRPIE